MAHKTFISYKYSESQCLRDDIIDSLGDDASYYQGETSESPDLGDLQTSTIKAKLAKMLFATSVTILVISPNMKESKWIEWEINYSLKLIPGQLTTSHRNGIVGVISKINGGYNWFKYNSVNDDGCNVINYRTEYLHNIVKSNRLNQNPKIYSCPVCKCVDILNGSYIAFVTEEDFLHDPQKYINNAYEKSENDASGYDIKLS